MRPIKYMTDEPLLTDWDYLVIFFEQKAGRKLRVKSSIFWRVASLLKLKLVLYSHKNTACTRFCVTYTLLVTTIIFQLVCDYVIFVMNQSEWTAQVG